MPPSLLSTALAWLATYAIHSTLLLAAAWAVTHAARRRGPRFAEVVWRTALFGGLATASLHLVLGAPLWQTPIVETREAAVTATLPAIEREVPLVESFAAVDVAPTEAVVAPEVEVPTSASVTPPSPRWLLALWPLGALLLAWQRGRRRRSFARDLRERRDVDAVDLDRRLRDLEREAGLARRVRLTATTKLATPVAFGRRRPEICVPERALDELPPDAMEAMLAHEVAHHARSDPAWLRAYHALTALFFFQPLNHVGVAHLRDTSEVLCDAWAARAEHRRLALAACLTAVADWILERPVPAPVPAMARRASFLGRRVRLLLDRAAERRPVGRVRTAAAALLPVVLVLALAPGVGVALDGAPPEGAVPLESPQDVDDTEAALAALDAEIHDLDGEVRDVQALLRRSGHADLAARLEARRRAVAAERRRLGTELDSLNPERR